MNMDLFEQVKDDKEVYVCPECGYRESKHCIDSLVCDVLCPKCEEIYLQDFEPLKTDHYKDE